MISAGNPRSLSNRANASKGEVVSTPPKSQITASIINSSAMLTEFCKRLTRSAGGNQSRLGVAPVAGYGCHDENPDPLDCKPGVAHLRARSRHRRRRRAFV